MIVTVSIADGKTEDKKFNLGNDDGVVNYTKHIHFAANCGYVYDISVAKRIFTSLLDLPK